MSRAVLSTVQVADKVQNFSIFTSSNASRTSFGVCFNTENSFILQIPRVGGHEKCITHLHLYLTWHLSFRPATPIFITLAEK